ncbi:hypothetical protein [Streptomyces sp. NPDC005805]|uniref:hypothetical protein n=1 Tax=Streptomyces sp. NPDC005805 TaxID=3157068 RepID=UPI0033F8A30E
MTATGAAVAGTLFVSAPTASAVAPGGGFNYSTLRCTTGASGGDGILSCQNKLDGIIWRAAVKCANNPFTIYYGPWRSNNTAALQTSVADSNCWWGVADVTISVA